MARQVDWLRVTHVLCSQDHQEQMACASEQEQWHGPVVAESIPVLWINAVIAGMLGDSLLPVAPAPCTQPRRPIGVSSLRRARCWH
jgi:hypothetical protein